jgi:hypothetical protein
VLQLSIARQTWIAAGVAAVFVCALAVWLGHPDYTMDDAYIVQHTVDGLLHGGETRYPGSTPLTGATSPAHVLLIASLSWLMPTPWAQLVIVGLAAIAYVAGCFHLARRSGVSVRWSAAIAALSALAGLSFYQLFNGLETGLAMAAIIWSLIWFFEPRPAQPWRYVLLGVLPYIRPELAAISLLLAVRAGWSEWQAGEGRAKNLGLAFAWMIAGAAPLALFLLANGQPLLPNTVSAKAFFFAEGCRPLVAKIQLAIRILGDFIATTGFALLGFAPMAFTRFRWIGLGFIAALLGAYIVQLPGALFHNYFRYLHVLMPLMIAGWIGAIASSDPRIRRLAQAGLAVALVWSVVMFGNCWTKYRDSIDTSRIQLRGVSEWVAEHVPSTATVLVHDAGYISHHGQQRLVDIVGLKTPSSIAAHRDYTWASCGPDARAIDQIALANNARYLVALKDWDRLFSFSEGLRARGWSVERIDGARGDTLYEVYAIAPPPVATPAG